LVVDLGNQDGRGRLTNASQLRQPVNFVTMREVASLAGQRKLSIVLNFCNLSADELVMPQHALQVAPQKRRQSVNRRRNGTPDRRAKGTPWC
jgi:hypothetical protein